MYKLCWVQLLTCHDGVYFIHVRTHVKITRQWKSTFSGEQIGRGMQLICAPFPPPVPGRVFSS